MNKIAVYSYIGVFLLMVTVVIGAFTRAYGAGMACGPDWPTCNGEIIPSFNFETALEYFHRVAAGLAFIAMVYASFLAVRQGGELRIWGAAVAVVLAFQVLLGAIVVKYHLSPPLSALHTSTAIVAVALATGLAVKANSLDTTRTEVKA